MLRLHMAFGITRGADAEITLAPDVFDQFTGISVVVGKGEFALGGDVPPECENILDPLLLQLFYHPVYLLLRGGDTGQVGKARHTKIIPDVRRDAHRILAGSAARSVSNADERRLKRRDLLCRGQDASISRIRLRRKYLKGYVRPFVL